MIFEWGGEDPDHWGSQECGGDQSGASHTMEIHSYVKAILGTALCWLDQWLRIGSLFYGLKIPESGTWLQHQGKWFLVSFAIFVQVTYMQMAVLTISHRIFLVIFRYIGGVITGLISDAILIRKCLGRGTARKIFNSVRLTKSAYLAITHTSGHK